MRKIFIIAMSPWTYKNNVIFRNYDVQQSHNINLVVIEDMKYYNVTSRIFDRGGSASGLYIF